MTKKLVLKLGVHDEKAKQKALKAVASLSGIDSLAMDMKEQKLTVIGAVDPVQVVRKLRKSWCADLLTVGPAKETEKKKEGESKKGDAKKEDGKKKEIEPIEAFWKPICENHYPYYVQCYHVCSCEESPYGCVIC